MSRKSEWCPPKKMAIASMLLKVNGISSQKRKGALNSSTQRRAPTFGTLRGQDLNLRPLGYEPNELPGCSTPHSYDATPCDAGQTSSPRVKTCEKQMVLCYQCASPGPELFFP